jgi:hypothetical protein
MRPDTVTRICQEGKDVHPSSEAVGDTESTTFVIHRYRWGDITGSRSQDHHAPLNKIESYLKYLLSTSDSINCILDYNRWHPSFNEL